MKAPRTHAILLLLVCMSLGFNLIIPLFDKRWLADALSTGLKDPQANTSGDFSDGSEAYTQNDDYAYYDGFDYWTGKPYDKSVMLFDGDAYYSDDYGKDDELPSSDTDAYWTYGAADDDWNYDFSAHPIDSDFSVLVTYSEGVIDETFIVSDFDITLPERAVVDGVVVKIDHYQHQGGPDSYVVEIDHITLNVTYTASSWTPIVSPGYNTFYNTSSWTPIVSPGYNTFYNTASWTPIGGMTSWWDASWSRCKVITITNAINTGAMNINVSYDADMNANFSDLRFVDIDNQTLCSHWIEKSVASNYARVWVNLSADATTDNKMMMYYGNPTAAPTSNGYTTFRYFDDFDDGDMNEYTSSGVEAWYTISYPSNNALKILRKNLNPGVSKDMTWWSNYTFNPLNKMVVGREVSYYSNQWSNLNRVGMYNASKTGNCCFTWYRKATWNFARTVNTTGTSWSSSANPATSMVYSINNTLSKKVTVRTFKNHYDGTLFGSGTDTRVFKEASARIYLGVYTWTTNEYAEYDWLLLADTTSGGLLPTGTFGTEISYIPGWNSFGNQSGYVLIDQGWNSFGNLSSWETIDQGWNTFKNERNWLNVTSGWNTFGNTSSWVQYDQGWNTFGNTSSWVTTQSGWNTFGNISSWVQYDQGWNTFKSERNWLNVTSGWNTFGNLSSWVPIGSFQRIDMDSGCGFFQNAVPSANYAQEWAEDVGVYMTGGSSQRIGQRLNTNYYIYRGCLFFDTSSSPSGTITSASLVLKIASKKVDAGHDFDLVIQDGQPSHPAKVNEDYDKDLYSGDYGSINTTSFNTNDWVSISFDVSLINTSGTTKLMVRSSRDIAGTIVAGPSPKDEYIVYDTGTSLESPYLILYYTPVGWNSFGNLSSWVNINQGWNSFGNTAIWSDEGIGWNVFGNASTFVTIANGWNTFKSLQAWTIVADGWNSFGNTATWSDEDVGWNVFGNASTFVTIANGWNTFKSLQAWTIVADGWNSFGNTATWSDEDVGWNTFGNASSWVQYDQGWNTFGTAPASWTFIDQGWNTFGNGASWTTIQGWNTFSNLSSFTILDQGWNTFGSGIVWFPIISPGWNTFGNTPAWSDRDQGWNTFLFASSWLTQQQGWNTFGNSIVWNPIDQGWNTFSNQSSWVPYDQGWNTFGNTVSWQTEDDGWNTFGNTIAWWNICIGWNTFGNLSSFILIDQGWSSFGNNNYTIFVDWSPKNGEVVDPASFTFLAHVDDTNGTLMDITWEYYDGASWHYFGSNETNVGNGSYYKMPSPWFDLYNHTYRYRVTVYGDQTVVRDVVFTTIASPSTGVVISDSMFGCLILLTIFGTFLPVGYAVRRRSAGMYLTMAGIVFIGIIAFLPFNVIMLALMLCFSGYITMLGIKKMFFSKL